MSRNELVHATFARAAEARRVVANKTKARVALGASWGDFHGGNIMAKSLVRPGSDSEAAVGERHGVHTQGSVEAGGELRVVWPLAGGEKVREGMGRSALEAMLERRCTNGHTPQLDIEPGVISADLGSTPLEEALTIAYDGVRALEDAEVVLYERIRSGQVEAGPGVGITASVVALPDYVG